jgi:hypothetical protein
MKTMSRFFAAVVVLSATPAPQHVASVQFTVLNRWGHFHNYRVLHFRASNTSPDLAAAFRGLLATNIPYGIYDYELLPAPGDASDENLSGSVWVYRDQIHVTNVLDTTDSLGHRAQLRVSGIVEPRPKGPDPVWVILANVYGKFRDESMVDDRGGFQLNYIWGNNVIIVCAGPEVLLSALVNVGPNDAVNSLHVNLKTGRVDTQLK